MGFVQRRIRKIDGIDMMEKELYAIDPEIAKKNAEMYWWLEIEEKDGKTKKHD